MQQGSHIQPRRTGRPDQRRAELTEFLRARIISGRLGPGARLPTQALLKARFGASNDTVQSAIHTLRRQGFVVPRGRAGTHVAMHPPHLHHFGLVVIETRRPDRQLSRYHLAMLDEARQIERQSANRFTAYHIEGGRTDTADYAMLERDVLDGSLAGLFFTMPPFPLQGSPVLDAPGMPRVTVGSRQLFPHVSVVTADMDSWFEQAIHTLKSAKRREVAIVALPPPVGDSPIGDLPKLLQRHGLRTHPHWNLYFEPGNESGVRNALNLLFHPDNRHRPGAVLILDDNLVEPATAGMVAAGVRPGEVEIIGMCNYPLPPAGSLPVTRLGYDMGTILRRAVRMIVARRRKEAVIDSSLVPAVLEHEWRAMQARRASGLPD